MPQISTPNVDDILDKAANHGITPDELDVLVDKTRELRARRERELKCLKALLSELEARQTRTRN